MAETSNFRSIDSSRLTDRNRENEQADRDPQLPFSILDLKDFRVPLKREGSSSEPDLLISQKEKSNLTSPEKTTAADVKPAFDELTKTLKTASNNEITLEELQRAIGNSSITGAEAQMLAILKARFHKFNALDPSTDENKVRLSRKAIEKFEEMRADVKAGKNTKQEDVDFVNEVDDLIKQMRTALKDTVRSLYADDKKPENSIKMECVRQGFIGNCYFYGAVGALLAVNPSAIKNMIKDEGDGTYTVTFPDKKPITVQAPSDAEIFLFPKPGKDGTWMWVLEKAYGQHCMDDEVCQNWRKMLGRKPTAVPQENTEGPSLFDDGLKFMTGKRIQWTFNLRPDRMIARLEALASEDPRRPITADASFNVKLGKDAPVWAHTYSVIAYDAKTQTITLRNPWGSSPPDNPDVKDLGDGKFTMSATDFCKYFNRLSYPRK